MRLLFNPLNDLLSMHNEFNRLMNRGLADQDAHQFSSKWTPAVDVYESEADYRVILDLPGFEKDDFSVTIHENTLYVQAERNMPEKSGLVVHRNERRYGKVNRAVQFPVLVKADAITASYKNGVLEIVCPKAEEVKPRQIQINVE
ncbi:MAG: Hsp20/alpha crystallin family protein [Candidatus Auribacterota bacterium]